MPKDFIISSDGKVVTGESTTQHIVDLATLHKGWHKFSPFVGAAIEEDLDDELDLRSINQRISEEVRKDGGSLTFDYADPQNIQWYGAY